jgi:hypothetical protein
VRTPQYVIPMRNPKYTASDWARFGERFHELKQRVRGTFSGFDYDFDYGPEGAGAAGFRVDLGPGAGHGPGSGASAAQPAPSSQASEGEERGGTARINFRLSEQLKGRIEEAAQRSGLSVNSWLQRAAAAALEEDGAPRRARQLPRGGDRLTGWIR